MKKTVLFLLITLVLMNVGVFADTGEVSIGDSIKSEFMNALGVFLITLLSILTFYLKQFINSFIQRYKDKSYYTALKTVENMIFAEVAEAENKLVDIIKDKFEKGSPERNKALSDVANRVLKNVEANLPEKVKDDISKNGEDVKGILPKLLEPVVKKHRWLGMIDFRDVRDKLNIPKI